ncbi:MAG: phosphoglycerate mutase (2,3-diphosphoglycerate-independent) [Bacteroidetes bacterium]|nr:MAG: phosphoglycerate mutase (2,3-diphosphoglycerate-independent) [Bacteroidota bacterium]
MNKRKVALVILDGWGYGAQDASDAIFNASTPCMDRLHKTHPHASLRTDGEFVGLPKGQMGNSEVGHMNIGAGRVVFQDLLRINQAIEKGTFSSEIELQNAISLSMKEGKRLHIMGLVSRGGVHSQLNHLFAIIDAVNHAGVSNAVIHAFTDGRDTPPMSGLGYLKELEDYLVKTKSKIKIATLHGRYFAMDRDKRWDRIAKSWSVLCDKNRTNKFGSVLDGIKSSYDNSIGDEFIEPFKIEGVDGLIRADDVVLCFNFRTDRCRQITSALTQKSYSEYGMNKLPLHYVTMTNYDDSFKDISVIYNKPNLVNTLGEVVSNCGLSQLRIAETEKYPHVTFFFNGGREEPFKGENRLMANSPKVATYDLKPEMSAWELVSLVSEEMKNDKADFVCLNFANPDMVGHTGIYSAIIKAVSTADSCLSEVIKVGLENDYQFVIIADHGNADLVMNSDGSPHTSHTTNPVPVIVISEQVTGVNNGKLADIAPTILDLLSIDLPSEMTGTSLIA